MAYILVDFRRYHDILDRIHKMPSPEVVAFNIGAWCFSVLFILWTLCMMQDFLLAQLAQLADSRTSHPTWDRSL